MEVIDQMDRKLEVPSNGPQRIVSLVPSQTELLYDLGLGEKVVGITKFCVHPDEWFKSKPKVGGTKLVLQKSIDALNPDLIIGNKEENTERDIRRLESKYPVWMSDVNTMEDALEMIREIGHITHKEDAAGDISRKVKTNMAKFEQQKLKEVSIAYFIWKDPWMVAGNNTFIHHFCKKTGFTNVFEDKDRYPEIDPVELKKKDPDYVFLSSEPFPFQEKHKELLVDFIPEDRIVLTDGQMFSWYGSRLIKGLQYALELRKKLLE